MGDQERDPEDLLSFSTTENTANSRFELQSRIKLQVGERQFITSRDTLKGESTYFAALLSGRWPATDADGSYFIDSDPALFEHVLRYLRTGNFPLFFDSATHTFDYGKYVALLGEAKYFGIAQLEKWIENKRYLDAVEIEYTTHQAESTDLFQQPYSGRRTVKADEKLEFTYGWGTKKVFICPRAIGAHRGNPDACGAKCHKAQAGSMGMFEDEPVMTGRVIKTKLVFKPESCLGLQQG
ncbi:Uu.00g007620.m01.CDS01 [Anthostomella pinea]|uniref:Uu.00g007620.m01.CDS01 n=1 Tax=Anthostomella pinea TaxID=933095 RepID=A0AAI8VY97_9PEZI|nr:Uu.00g007620.m01.CDS01 [Anthostomella pinea]